MFVQIKHFQHSHRICLALIKGALNDRMAKTVQAI